MKFQFLSISLVIICLTTQAQERHKPDIPDIPGYKTLICDFHMHTVFSDGLVWPTVRVDEAWSQGLDAIAITDHLEYLPHKEDIKTDFNRSWQIAFEYARNKDVIVIPGTEITKGMPPGHINALFIKDAVPIFNNDYNKAIEEAANQGAFVMWNHPGWKAQQPDTMKWWDAHSYLLSKGWLHGIEVVNSNEFYPKALDWALDSGLTVVGSSDMHAPFHEHHDLFSENHRSVTLVFATERSEGGIRDALFSGRTAACFDGKIIGESTFLQALFKESVQLIEINKSQKKYMFINDTDLKFDLLLEDKIYEDWSKEIIVKPGYEILFELPQKNDAENIEVDVKNFIIGSESVLKLKLSALLSVNN